MTNPYTEEDVELVAREIHSTASYCKATGHVAMNPDGACPAARHLARLALAAMSSAGRLVPPGSEVREEFGVRWNHGGEVLGLYKSGESARQIAGDRGIALHSKMIHTPWIPWSPSVPDTKEGS